MSNKKVPQDIIELEHYFNKYFDAHIAPLADKAVKDADAAYLKEYQQMVNDSGVFSSLTVTGGSCSHDGKVSESRLLPVLLEQYPEELPEAF